MIAAFVQHLTHEKRLSKHTIHAYKTDLNQCCTYLQHHCPPTKIEEASPKVLRAWMVAMAAQGLQNRSINRKIAALKAFYKFLRTKAVSNQDPTRKLKVLKPSKTLPIFLQENELLNLLDQYNFEDTFEGWRDKLVLELLYGTGIRLAELLSLRNDAINLYDHTISVLGKNHKERIIPFPKNLAKIITKYQAHKAATVNRHSTLLLVTATGAPCYPMMIYRLVKKYLRIYTSADRYSPHVLRHTFATHLLNKGADLNAIKELLGHKSLAATQLYTHNTLKKLKEVFTQAHPRA